MTAATWRDGGRTLAGGRRPVWTAGPDDRTPEHYGYASACSACWLGHGHTAAEHARSLARAVRP